MTKQELINRINEQSDDGPMVQNIYAIPKDTALLIFSVKTESLDETEISPDFEREIYNALQRAGMGNTAVFVVDGLEVVAYIPKDKT